MCRNCLRQGVACKGYITWIVALPPVASTADSDQDARQRVTGPRDSAVIQRTKKLSTRSKLQATKSRPFASLRNVPISETEKLSLQLVTIPRIAGGLSGWWVHPVVQRLQCKHIELAPAVRAIIASIPEAGVLYSPLR